MENERMAKLEVKVDEAVKDIENLKSDRNLLHKMNVLLEVQIDANKKSDRKMDVLEGVIHSVNDNLTSLNNNQEKLNEKLDIIDERVTVVEDRSKSNSDRGKFDMLSFFTVDLPKYVGLAIIAAVLTYIGLK